MADPIPPCIILNEPQLPENIGAVARAMANFGLSDLRIVRPREGWPQPRAWAAASGADWPLDNAKVFTRLEAAVADVRLLYATTARNRETRLPVLSPREAAEKLVDAGFMSTGLLFGGERAGLETADIALAQGILTIPIDPRFQSLNLAQAVVIAAYEWRVAAGGRTPARFRQAEEPAPQEQMIGLYEHLEGELETAGFFHPADKKPSMVRNLRVMLSRARFNEQEVRTFRGVVTALSKGRGRVLAKLAAQKGEREDPPAAGDAG